MIIPTDWIAQGLLIGNALFTAVGGYGLVSDYHAASAGLRLYAQASQSMWPTLPQGARLRVMKIAEYGHDLTLGDIVVFDKGGVPYVKRVVGLPNDRIQMVSGRLFRNGQVVDKVPKDPRPYQNIVGQVF